VRKIVLILFLVLSGLLTRAQDPQFSQFYAAPLYLSPSLAGATSGSRVMINFRDQWPSIPGAFITYSLAYDQYYPALNSGFGFLFTRDQAGTGRLGTTNMGFLYSYNIPVTKKWQIRPGLHFLRSQRTIDYSRLTFGDQLVNSALVNSREYYYLDDRIAYMDFSASMIVFTEQHWIGFTADHIIGPNQSLYNAYSEVPKKFSIYGGTKIVLRESNGRFLDESITPAFIYKSQLKYDQFDLGAYWTRTPIVVGFWYRGIPGFKKYKKGYQNNDALVILAGYKVENMSIGYSYDFTISRLVNNTGGSHELSIIYMFNQEQKSKRSRKKVIVPCPKF